jgi:putative transposase
MPRSRYRIYDTHYPHFVTCTIVNWLPLFGSPPIAQIVLDSWRFLQENQRIELYAYVIMEDHVHLIAAADDLAKEIGDFKSFTARQIVDWLQDRGASQVLDQLACLKLAHKTDRQFQVWQEGSHPEMIQGEAMMRQKAEYIHNNPVKRGYVDEPIHWRYSSARNYAGLTGLLEVTQAW